MTAEEQWRAIPDFEGMYEISDRGRVKSLKRVVARGRFRHSVRERILAAATQRKTGFLQVVLSNAGCQRRFYVHRLMREAFAPPGAPVLHTDR